MVFGLKERGSQGEPPFDRTTGKGYVAPRNGSYADAIAKKRTVILLGVENTGALMPGLVFLLRVLAKAVAKGGIQDSTIYGTSRLATKSFYAHHVAQISAAIVFADALVVKQSTTHQSRCAVLGDFLVDAHTSRADLSRPHSLAV